MNKKDVGVFFGMIAEFLLELLSLIRAVPHNGKMYQCPYPKVSNTHSLDMCCIISTI